MRDYNESYHEACKCRESYFPNKKAEVAYLKSKGFSLYEALQIAGVPFNAVNGCVSSIDWEDEDEDEY